MKNTNRLILRRLHIFNIFFEYVLKAFLESIHPIFGGKMDSKGFIDVYNHLNNLDTSVTAQSIEFSEALDRLLKIKKVNPKDPVISEIDFLLKKSDVLKTLNELRNRIWHKSLFFLRYKNLDLFLGVHILPLARKVMSLSRFSDNKSWLYKKLHCSVDPVDGIINECSKEDCSFERIALLKEMGRSAYLNPLVVVDNQKDFKQNIFFKCIAEQSNREKKNDALAKTDALCKNRFLTDVFDCPVCGQKTLIKYEFDDYEVEYDENNEDFPKPYYIPYKIKCETCSFEIHDNIDDSQMYGIFDPNFWQAHE